MAIGQETATRVFSSLSELIRDARTYGSRSKDMGATGTALGVLKALKNQDARPGDLATALRVVPSVISRTIAPLEQDGLVERKVHPVDGRASLIGLTPLGHDRLNRVQQVYVEHLREALDQWTEDEAELVVALLVKLDEALASYPRPEVHRRRVSEALLPPSRDDTAPSPEPDDAASGGPTSKAQIREQVSA